MTEETKVISAGDQPTEQLTRGQAFKNVYTHLKGLDIKDIIETKDMGRFKLDSCVGNASTELP